MKAVVIHGPGDITLVERPAPVPGPGEVQVRIARAGYCGSDLTTFRGLNPMVTYPRTPGHELSGTVSTVGEGVPAEWAPGTEVLILPYTSCGKCSACRQGRANSCRHNQTLGVQREGGMCGFLCVPWQKLMKAPGLDFAEMALVEPLTVGFHAAARGRVAVGETVVVLGCGAIGLGAIAGAAERGARVVAVDLDDDKIALARRAGAQVGIHSGRENLHERLLALTEGEGPEVIIEAVGQPATFRLAVEEVCFAGRVVYIGYAKAPVEYETKYFVQKELDILGSRNATPEDFQRVIGMLQAKRFPVAGAITRSVSLAEAPEAMRAWSADPLTVTKIQVVIGE
ncbi:MAG: zinc-binding alcohol dehydrogenase family protein [Candidatus Methylacidiphilales bacterium]|nr:zinc-binding alcohol dehydrogenase family protein [Candidatus Methylacidiphilales bacterium]